MPGVSTFYARSTGTADGQPLVVEDGTVVAGANTYNTLAAIIDYEAQYTTGTVFLDKSTAEQKTIARLATRAIDAWFQDAWKGSRSTRDQRTDWPRFNVRENRWWRPTSPLPQELRDAHAQLCVYAASDATIFASPSTTVGASVKRQKRKLGPLETDVEYVEGANSDQKVYSLIEALLLPLLKTGAGNTVNVSISRS